MQARIAFNHRFDGVEHSLWVAIDRQNRAVILKVEIVGDKQIANIKVNEANQYIMEARKADGNEGLTINDITPDFIRSRGIGYSDYSFSPNIDFNWGNLWTPF